MSEVSVINNQQQGQGEEEAQLELPPGFRFHPTDEEVVSHYLIPKALNMLFTCLVIADVDLNNCEPWDLPGKAKMGEKEWYFFWHKGRKYPTGTRTNRATPTGYWKATGRDKEIFRGRGVLVGMKKTLVFYLGRAPHGEKTPWVMHEFRLEGKLPPHLPPGAKDEWAVCRVFNKDLPAKQPGHGPSPALTAGFESFEPLPFNHGFFDDSIDLPPLVDSPFPDDFTDIKQGAASSAAGTSSSSGVKTEQQAVQNLTTNTHSAYFFSMPATTSRPGYSHSSAGNDQRPSAIRAPVALPPNEDVASSRLPYPELDDDLLFPFSEDFIGDYSDMWKV